MANALICTYRNLNMCAFHFVCLFNEDEERMNENDEQTNDNFE